MHKSLYLTLFISSLLISYSLAQTCKDLKEYWPQVQKIVNAMSLDQKIGQMTQGDVPQMSADNVIDPSQVQQYNLGSVLIGGNYIPSNNTLFYSNYLDLFAYPNATADNFQHLGDILFQPTTIDNVQSEDSDDAESYEIYPLLGTDAVHGNQHIIGSVLFPHNIGLASTHDPDCFRNAGYFMGKDVLATGFNYAFAPTVAVSHNYQWGRHYETMGSETDWIEKYARAFVDGAQSYNPQTQQWDGVLSSTKHFLGDGATFWGIDEGNDTVHNVKEFLDVNYAGYSGAIDSCGGNVMCSYSAINRIPMAANAELLQGVLKDGIYNNKPFNGFIISDYDEIGKMAGQQWPTSNIKMTNEEAVIQMINSGIDMGMLASTNWWLNIPWFRDTIKNAVSDDEISIDRINDAVTRILGVKMAMGLIKKKNPANKNSQEMTNAEYAAEKVKNLEDRNPTPFKNAWEASLDAAQKSLVLLQNNNSALPLKKDGLKYVVLIGERTINQVYDGQSDRIDTVYQDTNNIGVQNGGWSLRWQGFEGNQFWSGEYKESSHATSILDALKSRFNGNDVQILMPEYASATDMDAIAKTRTAFITQLQGLAGEMTPDNTIIIGAMGEVPYAEFMGDINNPFCDMGYGCIYWAHANPYTPDDNKKTLDIGYDDFSKQVVSTINSGKTSKVKLITVLFSGRPMIITDTLAMSDAFIAAWLPGTQGGEAIVSAIMGEYLFKGGDDKGLANTLPVAWIDNMDVLVDYPIYKQDGSRPVIEHPVFEIGFGLKTTAPAKEIVQIDE